MNRITRCLSKIKENNRKALVTYIVAGDPQPEMTLRAMQAIAAAGADIIELGVPFSDPMAEGPVIQRGHERALVHRFSLRQTLDVVRQFRADNKEIPVVLMGYANPVERMGYSQFAVTAAEAGVDGVLTVDLPPEEAIEANRIFKESGLETIFLLAPTSTGERIRQVTALAGGFLYYVSLKGVTGAGNLDVESVKQQVDLIRQHSPLPILVGFGIKDAESAVAVSRCADGVIVGSALVEVMGSGQSNDSIIQGLSAKIADIRQALDTL